MRKLQVVACGLVLVLQVTACSPQPPTVIIQQPTKSYAEYQACIGDSERPTKWQHIKCDRLRP